MAYIITRLCRDCKDLSCVEVCPVECIFDFTGDDPEIPKSQLLIDPDICIDCNACEPACPWEAIFADTDLPDIFAEDKEINARITAQEDARRVPMRDVNAPMPSEEDVKKNKEKWDFSD